jgi:hypothetical protein
MLFLTGVFSSVLLRGLRTYSNVISGVAMMLLGVGLALMPFVQHGYH